MEFAPIILFVYNRLEHTIKTVEALKLNNLASDSSLFIFSDANKNENDLQKVTEVRNYISKISGFKEINIILREINLGLANSVISGVTEIVEKYGKVIVIEDDIVTSKYFLKFMNEALDFYKADKNIYSISGYNFPVKIPKSYKHQIYVSPRPSSWGWATWKDRWEKAIWNPEKVLDIKNLNQLNNFVDKVGKDIAPMLLKSIEGRNNSWAVKWVYTNIKYNALTIFPVKSYVKNIGADASGTNFIRSTNKYDVSLDYESQQFEFVNNLEINEEIFSQIKRIVRPGLLSYIKYRLFNIY
jgi:hypothetical protein